MFTPRDFKNETVAFLGEFMGTYLFLFFSFAGAQTVNHAAAAKATPESKNLPTLDDLIFISLIFGMSLTVNVWIFFRISGGMFNPVVSYSFGGNGGLMMLTDACGRLPCRCFWLELFLS